MSSYGRHHLRPDPFRGQPEPRGAAHDRSAANRRDGAGVQYHPAPSGDTPVYRSATAQDRVTRGADGEAQEPCAGTSVHQLVLCRRNVSGENSGRYRRLDSPREEDTLAIFKWRLGAMSPSNRWCPVLIRYITYIEGRVRGLGGDPDKIPPSPNGAPPKHEPPRDHLIEHTGKVSEIIYDCFGGFEGFVLCDCDEFAQMPHAGTRDRDNRAPRLPRAAFTVRVRGTSRPEDTKTDHPVLTAAAVAPPVTQ